VPKDPEAVGLALLRRSKENDEALKQLGVDLAGPRAKPNGRLQGRLPPL
jgi:hypothetical protein